MTTNTINTNNNAAVSVGSNIKIRFDLECAIPCIKVECPAEMSTNPHGNVGYLMPFRAYRFQVCGNREGEWDLGSSDVRHMKDLLEWMAPFQQIDYLREQAVIALMRWQDAYEYGICLDADQKEIFDQFIKECKDWVMSR